MARTDDGAVMQGSITNACGRTHGYLAGRHAAGKPSETNDFDRRRYRTGLGLHSGHTKVHGRSMSWYTLISGTHRFTLRDGKIKMVNEYYCTILADEKIAPLLAGIEEQRKTAGGIDAAVRDDDRRNSKCP